MRSAPSIPWPRRGFSTWTVLTLPLATLLAVGCRNDEEPAKAVPDPAEERGESTDDRARRKPPENEGQGSSKAPRTPTQARTQALKQALTQRMERRALPSGALLDAQGRLVIDESSLGAGERVACLDALMARAFATPERAKPWREAGVDAAFTAEGHLRIALSKPAVVAVSSMACQAPRVRLETQGHPLTLVGSDFQNALVDTRQTKGKAGDLEIVTTGTSTPDVVADGAPGAPGADAACPPGFETCTSAVPPAFPRAELQPLVQMSSTARAEPGNALAPNGKSYVDALNPPPFARTPPPLGGDCPGGKAELLGGPKVSYTGHVRVTTRVSTPRWPPGALLEGRDGLSFDAHEGTPGDAGGALDVLGLGDVSFDRAQWTTAGGRGGAPGVGGLVAAAPGVAATVATETTTVEVEAHSAKVLGTFQWRLHEVFFVSPRDPSCARTRTKVRTLTTTEAVSPRTPRATVSTTLSRVTLPGGRDGLTPSRPVASEGARGPNGVQTVRAAVSVESVLKRIPESVRVPTRVAADLTAAWNKGGVTFQGERND